jgi:hypothetical protein
MELIPREHWTDWSHWLIWHGRRRCYARKPDCGRCEVFKLCPSRKVFFCGQARQRRRTFIDGLVLHMLRAISGGFESIKMRR